MGARLGLRALVATAGAMCALLALGHGSAHAGATFTGGWSCNDRGTLLPLSGAKVELWNDQGWFGSHIVATGFTDDDGRFRLQAPANDEDLHWVRVVLRDRFDVHLKPWHSPWEEWFDTPRKLRNTRGPGERDLGGWQVREQEGRATPKCAAWRGVHIAAEEYLRDVGRRIPQPDLLVRGDAPNGGVPFTAHSAINWPPDYPTGAGPGDITTPRHEFAHAFRHWFDGNAVHFFADVALFNYLRHHHACLPTNRGFAFNEGWAEYWAGDFGPAPDCPGIAPTDFNVEGNVAAEIARLERECLNISRRSLVEALMRAGSRIHAMEDLGVFLPGCVRSNAVSAPTKLVYREIVHSQGAQTAQARQGLRALRTQTVRAVRQLRAARRTAARPPRCVRRPCLRSLDARTRPAVLEGRVSSLRLLRRTLAFTASPRALKKLGTPGSRGYERALERRRRGLGKALARVGARMSLRALRAGRPVFARDRSRGMKLVHRRMRSALRAFRRGRSSGRLPGFLRQAGLGSTARLRPSPVARPPVGQRRPSSTALACPSKAERGTRFDLSGEVSPGREGSAVSLSYRSSKNTTVRSVTTDADGRFSDAFTPLTDGPLDIEARFAGDAFVAPSTVTCRVMVEEPPPP